MKNYAIQVLEDEVCRLKHTLARDKRIYAASGHPTAMADIKKTRIRIKQVTACIKALKTVVENPFHAKQFIHIHESNNTKKRQRQR